MGLPGVEMVNGPCRIFFDYARPSQLPYNENPKNKIGKFDFYIKSPHSYPLAGAPCLLVQLDNEALRAKVTGDEHAAVDSLEVSVVP